MSDPFLGEIRMVPYNFAPRGWAYCDGQLLPISQNTALFSLLGTTYGGDGRTTFALPDLRGRVPLHDGGSTGPGLSSYFLGQKGGAETVTLAPGQMPEHTHQALCHATGGDGNSPVGKYWSKDLGSQSGTYHSAGGASMHPGALGTSGGNQPHANIQPYLALNFIIALVGIYPSRN